MNALVESVCRPEELLRRASALPVDRARLEYLAGVLQTGVPALVANAGPVRMEVVLVADKVVPVVVNDGNAGVCYLVSPQGHYVKYAREELAKLRPVWLARALSGFLCGFGAFARCLDFDRCVSINNWLLPTNPRLDLTDQDLAVLTSYLCQRYAGHALVFRTVGAERADLRSKLARGGYRLVLNRPVHWWDPNAWSELGTKKRYRINNDLRQFDRCGLKLRSGWQPAAEPGRLHGLYEQLYIIKHSRLNAHFTSEFFRSAGRGFLELDLATLADQIVGFQLTFADGDTRVITQLGYDTAYDQRHFPIYRGLLASAVLRARDENVRLFLSTGAAHYKQLRGAVERLEYEAVYDRHLRWPRRLPWQVIGAVGALAVRGLDTGRM